MRKIAILSLAGLLGVALGACEQSTPPTIPDAEVATSHANNVTVGTAGIYRLNSRGIPVQHIADVTITDDGTKLTVTGDSENIPETGGRFFSLFYGKGSHQYGETACLPSPNEKKLLTGAQMFIGFWGVGSSSSDGVLELSSEMTGAAYTPLSEIETISVRDGRDQGSISIQPSLIGCGKIQVHP